MSNQPLIVGVFHRFDNLAEVQKVINGFAKQGVKSIGVEYSAIEFRVEIKKFLQRQDINTIFKRDLELLLDHLGTPPKFFKRIIDTVKNRGLKVHLLEGKAGAEAVVRIALEQLNKKWSKQRSAILWGRNAPGKDPISAVKYFDFMLQRERGRFPASFVQLNLRSHQMLRKVEKYRPDAVIVGLAHALFIARKLGVPEKEIQILGNPSKGSMPKTIRTVKFTEIRNAAKRKLGKARRNLFGARRKPA